MAARGPDIQEVGRSNTGPSTEVVVNAGPSTEVVVNTWEQKKENDSEKVGGTVDTGAQVVVTDKEADKKANDILESEETKAVLDKMERIEDYINNIQGEELNSYKWIILEYKSIKDDIQKKMEEDPNFQAAMKQMWKSLDKNDQPLNQIPEPEAWEKTSEILTSIETQKQIEKANYVISWYDKLSPDQQAALNKWLAIFKERIENVARDLGLN